MVGGAGDKVSPYGDDDERQALGSYTECGEDDLIAISMRFKRLVCCVERFVSLQCLDVSCNLIEAFPTGDISLLPNLRYLDISRNCIRSLRHLPTAPRLQVLNVARNALSNLDGIEAYQEQLRVLDVSYNEVTGCGPLGRCKKLRYLDLTANRRLTELKLRVLASLPCLRVLTLGTERPREVVRNMIPSLAILNNRPVRPLAPPGMDVLEWKRIQVEAYTQLVCLHTFLSCAIIDAEQRFLLRTEPIRWPHLLRIKPRIVSKLHAAKLKRAWNAHESGILSSPRRAVALTSAKASRSSVHSRAPSPRSSQRSHHTTPRGRPRGDYEGSSKRLVKSRSKRKKSRQEAQPAGDSPLHDTEEDEDEFEDAHELFADRFSYGSTSPPPSPSHSAASLHISPVDMTDVLHDALFDDVPGDVRQSVSGQHEVSYVADQAPSPSPAMPASPSPSLSRAHSRDDEIRLGLGEWFPRGASSTSVAEQSEGAFEGATKGEQQQPGDVARVVLSLGMSGGTDAGGVGEAPAPWTKDRFDMLESAHERVMNLLQDISLHADDGCESDGDGVVNIVRRTGADAPS